MKNPKFTFFKTNEEIFFLNKENKLEKTHLSLFTICFHNNECKINIFYRCITEEKSKKVITIDEEKNYLNNFFLTESDYEKHKSLKDYYDLDKSKFLEISLDKVIEKHLGKKPTEDYLYSIEIEKDNVTFKVVPVKISDLYITLDDIDSSIMIDLKYGYSTIYDTYEHYQNDFYDDSLDYLDVCKEDAIKKIEKYYPNKKQMELMDKFEDLVMEMERTGLSFIVDKDNENIQVINKKNIAIKRYDSYKGDKDLTKYLFPLYMQLSITDDTKMIVEK